MTEFPAFRLPIDRKIISRSVFGVLLIAGGFSFPLTSPGLAQDAPAVATYTEEQADRGEDAYGDNCAGCHGATLGGDGETPALAGDGFRNRWFSETALPFFAYISNAMPQQAPGTLEPQMYADIMSFILM